MGFPINFLGLFCLDGKVAEIRSAVVNEVNELGETALATAAGKGHLEGKAGFGGAGFGRR